MSVKWTMWGRIGDELHAVGWDGERLVVPSSELRRRIDRMIGEGIEVDLAIPQTLPASDSGSPKAAYATALAAFDEYVGFNGRAPFRSSKERDDAVY